MKHFAILALTAGLVMAQNQTNRTGSVNPSATDVLNSMGSTVIPGNQTAPAFPKPENTEPVAERQAPPAATEGTAESAPRQAAAEAPQTKSAPAENTQPAQEPEPQQATQATPPAQPEPSAQTAATAPAGASDEANRAEVANNEMPATSLNWLGFLLGGGALSGVGLLWGRAFRPAAGLRPGAARKD